MAIGVDSLLAVLEDPAPEENWAKAEPVKGDHIRVRRIGGYTTITHLCQR